MESRISKCLAALFLGFQFLVVAACSNQESSSDHVKRTPQEEIWHKEVLQEIKEAHARDVPTIAVAMTCSDHHPPSTPGNVGRFAVEEVWYGQITKRFVNGIGCGGDMHVGYPLPAKWQPHMKVLVRWVPPWSDDRNYTIERYTTIPYYAEAATLAVHFFSKDRVRVVVSSIGPEGTHHPIPPGTTEPPAEVDGELEQPPNPPNPTPTPKIEDVVAKQQAGKKLNKLERKIYANYRDRVEKQGDIQYKEIIAVRLREKSNMDVAAYQRKWAYTPAEASYLSSPGRTGQMVIPTLTDADVPMLLEDADLATKAAVPEITSTRREGGGYLVQRGVFVNGKRQQLAQ